MKPLCVAVVGATGAVGQEMLSILERRPWPIREIRLFSSVRSLGKKVRFRGRKVPVRVLGPGAFVGADVALFDAPGSVSKQFAHQAVREGAFVVDHSSVYRMEKGVPLVVPEVNGSLVTPRTRLATGPNCVAIPLTVALAPLARAAGLRRIVVSTYQAVSGAGAAAARALYAEARDRVAGKPPRATVFTHPMAFNCVAHETFEDEGYTDEEWKIVGETRKILGLPRLPISVAAVRVPVVRGHSMSVFVETRKPLSAAAARKLLARAPGVILEDDPSRRRYPTPLLAAGKDAVYVGRVRRDIGIRNGLAFWLSCDNLRKGAALNAIQIAEEFFRGLSARREARSDQRGASRRTLRS